MCVHLRHLAGQPWGVSSEVRGVAGGQQPGLHGEAGGVLAPEGVDHDGGEHVQEQERHEEDGGRPHVGEPRGRVEDLFGSRCWA